jgi:pimeloyl-ACP methyl ester carboxylesterase
MMVIFPIVATEADGMSKLVRLVESEAPVMADVLFVHGLGGDLTTTWTHRNGYSLASAVGKTLRGVNVWSLGYEASPSVWVSSKTMPLTDRAINCLALLDAYGVGERPLAVVAHSMGGLLTKQMLHHSHAMAREFGSFSRALRGVVFLSTPHSGSPLASICSMLSVMTRETVSMRELQANEPHLRELQIWYRNNVETLGVKTTVLYEKRDAIPGVRIVDEASADPGLSGVTPIPIDADHSGICKPDSDDSLVSRIVVNSLRRCLGVSVQSDPAPSRAQPAGTTPSIHRLLSMPLNFVYVSTEKVNMLWPQVPDRDRRTICRDLGLSELDPGGELIRGATLSAEGYTRLRIVTEYLIQRVGVGQLGEASSYIVDRIPLRWALSDSVVYFGGHKGGLSVGLAGSRGHVMGRGECGQMADSGGGMYGARWGIRDGKVILEHPFGEYEATPILTARNVLVEALQRLGIAAGFGVKIEDRDRNDTLDAVREASVSLGGPVQEMVFCARVLLSDARQDSSACDAVLATPLFVALA